MPANDLFADLHDDQLVLLRAIYQASNDGCSAQWRSVKRRFRRISDADPVVVRKSLPSVGSRGAGLPSYSAVMFDHSNHADDCEMRLTIAAGLHLAEYRSTANGVMRMIAYLAKQVADAHGDEPIMVTRGEVARGMDLALRQLPTYSLLRTEPYCLASPYHLPADDGDWTLQLNDDGLYEYRDVSTIAEYVTKVVERIERDVAFYFPSASPEPPRDTSPQITGSPYVDAHLLDELARLSSTEWQVKKLGELLRELNVAHSAGLVNACLMLSRAVLDHVPPLFGKERFTQVSHNMPWEKNDKKYMQKLEEVRLFADDCLHRKADQGYQPVTFEDLPKPAYMNALVRMAIKCNS
ncbi:hypothetical protein ACFPM7_28085 [Actinokineospora guangxiensis]|uniref:Uncharacterized protein n=1 Tax=Actinokineospora guangxiensis TaxID=1490288 RepID=A0ABW0EUZ8_9PSEU